MNTVHCSLFSLEKFCGAFSKATVPSFPRPLRALKKLGKLKTTKRANKSLLSEKFCGAFSKATVPSFPRSLVSSYEKLLVQ